MSIEKISAVTANVNIIEIESQPQEGPAGIKFPSRNFHEIKDNYDKNNKVYAEKLVKTVSPEAATGSKNFEPGSLNFPNQKNLTGSADTRLPLIDPDTIEKIKPKNIKGRATTFTEKIKSMGNKRDNSPALSSFFNKSLEKDGFLLTALLKLAKQDPIAARQLMSIKDLLPRQESLKVEALLTAKSSLSTEFSIIIAGTMQASRNLAKKLSQTQRNSPFLNTLLQLNKKFAAVLESGDRVSIMLFACFIGKLNTEIKKPNPNISAESEKFLSLIKNPNDKDLKDYLGISLFEFIKSELKNAGRLKENTAEPETGKSSLPLISKTLETPVSVALKPVLSENNFLPDNHLVLIARNITANDVKTTFTTSSEITEAFKELLPFPEKLTALAVEKSSFDSDIPTVPLFDADQLLNFLTQQMLRQITNELINKADQEESMLNLLFETPIGENDPGLQLVLRFQEILKELSNSLKELIASELSKKQIDQNSMDKNNDTRIRIEGLDQAWETIREPKLELLEF